MTETMWLPVGTVGRSGRISVGVYSVGVDLDADPVRLVANLSITDAEREFAGAVVALTPGESTPGPAGTTVRIRDIRVTEDGENSSVQVEFDGRSEESR